MSINQKNETTGLAHKREWHDWWDANKTDFRIIKTAKEAFGQK
jgi:hypothetical protein